MNIKDLKDYEIVEEKQEETKPLNLADLQDYEVVEPQQEKSDDSSTPSVDLPGALEIAAVQDDIIDKSKQAGKAIKGAGKSAVSKIPFGALDQDDISRLYDQRARYKEIKNKPGIVGDKFAEFAEDVQQTGYNATKNVGDVLEGQGVSMKTDDLLGELETKASDITYQPDAERLKEAETSSLAAKEADKKLKKAEGYFSKQELETRKKLEELEDRIGEYKQRRFEKQEFERVRDLEVKSINERIDVLKDEKYEYNDPKASKEINREIELLNREKRKLSESLKDETYGLKKSVESDVDVIKKLEQQKKDLKRQLKNETLPTKKKELSRLQELKASADKTASDLSIQRKALTEEAEKYLARMKKQLSNKKTLTGQDLAAEMKRLNKQFGKPGADEIRKAFREMLQEMSAYVGQSGQKAAQAITDYENAIKDLPLEQVDEITAAGKGTKVRQKGDFNRALAGAFTPTEGAEKVAKSDIVEMLKRYGRADLVEDAELNKIVQLMNESGSSLVDAYAAVKTGGMAAAPTSRLLGTIGTKAQELATLGAGKVADLAKSPVGKALGKAGKFAGKALPLVGAAIDYSEASELGIESPAGKALYAAVESLNPLPISAVDMARQAPMKSAAARRAAAANTGIQEGPKREITINKLKDPETTQQLIYKLSEMGTSSTGEYARRIQNVVNGAGTKEEYTRKMSLLASEPAFREIMRRIGDDDGKKN